MMITQTTEEKAERVLRACQPVQHISDFGNRLLLVGVLRETAGKRYTRQGLALLAGKWLRRMERMGLARLDRRGWVTTDMPPNARNQATEPA